MIVRLLWDACIVAETKVPDHLLPRLGPNRVYLVLGSTHALTARARLEVQLIPESEDEDQLRTWHVNGDELHQLDQFELMDLIQDTAAVLVVQYGLRGLRTRREDADVRIGIRIDPDEDDRAG